MIRKPKIGLYLILILSGCVKSLDADFPQSENRLLVVEGGITTTKNIHRIQLTRTARYGSIFDGIIEPETGALVSIRDDEGSTTFLEEVDNGVYITDGNFSGVVGKSYSLQIITRSGEEFNSIPEKITAVAEINSLSPRFTQRETDNPLIPITGVELIVQFDDPSEQRNYYRWSYQGVYVIKARPDLHLDMDGNPAPLDCCTTCWSAESNNLPNVISDNLIDGRTSEIVVAFIEDDGVRFGDKYHIIVKQQSLSVEAFEFFELINQQLQIDGDIFDPPPATIRGNMINLQKQNQNVIGYFTAVDERIDSLFIYPSDLDFVKQSVIRGDCRNQKANATVTAPNFWE